MAASLVGGLLAQWPLGALSDRINRRYVIMLASALVCVSSAILFMMALWAVPAETCGMGWLIVIGTVFGAGFHSLYSLCIAHANDFVGDAHFVHAGAGLQFIQGIGAIIGPLLAGVLMYLGGYAMLFVDVGTLAGLFILYTLKRMAGNRKPSEGTTSPFRLLTRTGVFAFFMDPRYRGDGNDFT